MYYRIAPARWRVINSILGVGQWVIAIDLSDPFRFVDPFDMHWL